MKILLKIAYNGQNYHGWQVQKNGISIQSEMCRAAKEAYGCEIKVTGCSRTDSGVHAKEYFCTLETPENAPCIPENKLPTALNVRLPEDIAVYSAVKVKNDFHPRYSVTGKTYEYVINDDEYRDPFGYNREWKVKTPLNVMLMNKASKEFIGEYDFSAFMASGSDIINTVRRVYNANVVRRGGKIVFSVSANGFLYNMVRIMAGTLVNVAQGKIKPEEIKEIILSKDRKKAGVTAPACGLYLSHVDYPDDVFEK